MASAQSLLSKYNGGNAEVESEMLVYLKQILKKDDQTKLKGYRNLFEKVKSGGEEPLEALFSSHLPLIRIYLDNPGETKVRELQVDLLCYLVEKLQKKAVEGLKSNAQQGASVWLLFMCDTNLRVSTKAREGFKKCFPTREKRRKILQMAQKQSLLKRIVEYTEQDFATYLGTKLGLKDRLDRILIAAIQALTEIQLALTEEDEVSCLVPFPVLSACRGCVVTTCVQSMIKLLAKSVKISLPEDKVVYCVEKASIGNRLRFLKFLSRKQSLYRKMCTKLQLKKLFQNVRKDGELQEVLLELTKEDVENIEEVMENPITFFLQTNAFNHDITFWLLLYKKHLEDWEQKEGKTEKLEEGKGGDKDVLVFEVVKRYLEREIVCDFSVFNAICFSLPLVVLLKKELRKRSVSWEWVQVARKVDLEAILLKEKIHNVGKDAYLAFFEMCLEKVDTTWFPGEKDPKTFFSLLYLNKADSMENFSKVVKLVEGKEIEKLAMQWGVEGLKAVIERVDSGFLEEVLNNAEFSMGEKEELLEIFLSKNQDFPLCEKYVSLFPQVIIPYQKDIERNFFVYLTPGKEPSFDRKETFEKVAGKGDISRLLRLLMYKKEFEADLPLFNTYAHILGEYDKTVSCALLGVPVEKVSQCPLLKLFAGTPSIDFPYACLLVKQNYKFDVTKLSGFEQYCYEKYEVEAIATFFIHLHKEEEMEKFKLFLRNFDPPPCVRDKIRKEQGIREEETSPSSSPRSAPPTFSVEKYLLQKFFTICKKQVGSGLREYLRNSVESLQVGKLRFLAFLEQRENGKEERVEGKEKVEVLETFVVQEIEAGKLEEEEERKVEDEVLDDFVLKLLDLRMNTMDIELNCAHLHLITSVYHPKYAFKMDATIRKVKAFLPNEDALLLAATLGFTFPYSKQIHDHIISHPLQFTEGSLELFVSNLKVKAEGDVKEEQVVGIHEKILKVIGFQYFPHKASVIAITKLDLPPLTLVQILEQYMEGKSEDDIHNLHSAHVTPFFLLWNLLFRYGELLRIEGKTERKESKEEELKEKDSKGSEAKEKDSKESEAKEKDSKESESKELKEESKELKEESKDSKEESKDSKESDSKEDAKGKLKLSKHLVETLFLLLTQQLIDKNWETKCVEDLVSALYLEMLRYEVFVVAFRVFLNEISSHHKEILNRIHKEHFFTSYIHRAIQDTRKKLKEELSGIETKLRFSGSSRQLWFHFLKDEMEAELCFQFQELYPIEERSFSLNFPNERGNTFFGVPKKKYRNWLVAASKCIALPKICFVYSKNFALYYEGVEDCMICYSVISASNMQIPKKPCTTCKHKFHFACLSKWWASSGKTICPLCKQPILNLSRFEN